MNFHTRSPFSRTGDVSRTLVRERVRFFLFPSFFFVFFTVGPKGSSCIVSLLLLLLLFSYRAYIKLYSSYSRDRGRARGVSLLALLCSHLRSWPRTPFIFSSISICGLWQRCDGGSLQGNTLCSLHIFKINTIHVHII